MQEPLDIQKLNIAFVHNAEDPCEKVKDVKLPN